MQNFAATFRGSNACRSLAIAVILSSSSTLAVVAPKAVFHAAAYKHVPLLQGQLREAIRNNAIATWTVAKAAAQRMSAPSS